MSPNDCHELCKNTPGCTGFEMRFQGGECKPHAGGPFFPSENTGNRGSICYNMPGIHVCSCLCKNTVCERDHVLMLDCTVYGCRCIAPFQFV